MLILQTERADQLQKKLDATERQLHDRDIRLANLGSIAEASLQLSGVFEAAQSAADRYLEAAKQQAAEIEQEAHRNARRILADAEEKARRTQNNE